MSLSSLKKRGAAHLRSFYGCVRKVQCRDSLQTQTFYQATAFGSSPFQVFLIWKFSLMISCVTIWMVYGGWSLCTFLWECRHLSRRHDKHTHTCRALLRHCPLTSRFDISWHLRSDTREGLPLSWYGQRRFKFESPCGFSWVWKMWGSLGTREQGLFARSQVMVQTSDLVGVHQSDCFELVFKVWWRWEEGTLPFASTVHQGDTLLLSIEGGAVITGQGQVGGYAFSKAVAEERLIYT